VSGGVEEEVPSSACVRVGLVDLVAVGRAHDCVILCIKKKKKKKKRERERERENV
jgi:hypothetical protein